MQIDPAAHTAADSYKLLTNLVVPRPIAWVTTQNAEGVINLAPFSFFNAVASDPLYVAVSVGSRDDGAPKDTAANILANGEFVVNLVTEELFDAMNISAADFPPELRSNAPTVSCGPTSHHVHYPLRHGEKYNIVVTFHSRQQEVWSVSENCHAAHRRGAGEPRMQIIQHDRVGQ